MLKTADFPQFQVINKVINISVVVQRPVFMVQPVQMTTAIPQLLVDKVVDFPVWQVVRVPQVHVVQMTVVIPQLQLVENFALP